LILQKCFELDWSRTKIDKIIKDEEQREKVKQLMRSNYKWFRESYKAISAIEMQ
jgi:hypothetical protein